MHDLPLVIFTILSQLILGGFVTLWWIDRKKAGISRKTGLLISISFLILGGLSLSSFDAPFRSTIFRVPRTIKFWGLMVKSRGSILWNFRRINFIIYMVLV